MPAVHRLPAPLVPFPPPGRLTAPVAGPPPDDQERWVADGYDAAYRADLADLARADAAGGAAGRAAGGAAGGADLSYGEIFPRLHRVSTILAGLR